MPVWVLLCGFLLSCILGLVILPNILLVSHKKHLFDMPDARKVHTAPIPRLGGLAFFPVILITVFMMTGISMYSPLLVKDINSIELTRVFLFLFAGMTLLYLVGEADDLVGVGYKVKFLVQIIASCLMVLSGTWLHSLWGLFGVYELPAWIGMPLTVVMVVYITNAINLIDGIDGLASGLCAISLVVICVMFTLRDDFVLALTAFSTLGVIVPFWFFNVFGSERRGHKLFMGDTGSLTLGYILSFLVLRMNFPAYPGADGSRDMVLALSTLIVPLFDVVRVFLHRVRKHRNPFLPDKNHIHHKLLRTGMRIRWVLMTILLIVVMYIILNAMLLKVMDVTLILLLDIVLWTAIHLFINQRIRIYAKEHPSAGKSYIEGSSEEMK